MEVDSDTDLEKDALGKNPRAKANFFSIATFFWTTPTFYRGLKKDFNEKDLTRPLPEHSSDTLSTRIEKAWKVEIERSQQAQRDPSFFHVVVRVFHRKFLLYAIPIFFTEMILRVLQPLLIGQILRYFEPNSTMSTEEAYGYATGIAGCSIFSVLIMHPYMQGTIHLGMKLRVAATNLIYKKALCISKMSRGKTSSGQVINLMSNDVGKFDYSFLFLHILWIGPLQTLVVTVLVWLQIGIAAIFGIIAILIAIPLQVYLTKCASRFRLQTSYRTDERIRIMNEIITGMQVIKMYTWEVPFAKLAASARKKEIKEVTKLSYVKGVLLSFITFHTRVALFVVVLAYVLMGNTVEARRIFVVVGLISTLRQTMTVAFPQSLFAFVESLVSMKRITKFLIDTDNIVSKPRGPEDSLTSTVTPGRKLKSLKKPNLLSVNKPKGRYVRIGKIMQNPGVKIEDASAKWDSTSPDMALNNLSMRVRPQQLTVVIGPVGSGKTTLLHALLNELFLTSGTIYVSGSISYASQEPWIFNGTIRENILFGSNYLRERYHKVIRICKLKKDLELLPYGDRTLLSERGTPLSGGQRARVNLARAIYKESDIYLLDDPLSAVDTEVGKHLFEDCIRNFLKDKTVILVTHQVQYLADVPQIILMNNGNIKATGTYNELLTSGQEFLQALADQQEQAVTADDVLIDPDQERKKSDSRPPSRRSSSYTSTDSNFDPTGIAEVQTLGSVKLRIYGKYLGSMGNRFMIGLMIFMFILSQALASAADYWISYWINIEDEYFKHNHGYALSRDDFTMIFCALSVGVTVVTLLRSFLFFRMAMRASITLHNQMFNSIVRATMNFFSKNNAGRVLNRFSRDIGIVDELLPQTLIDVMQIGIALLAIVTLVAIVNYWLLIVTFFCFVIFYLLRTVYISTGRGIKRVEGICRSPLYGHVNSTLIGLATIRAFNAEQQMTIKFQQVLDRHSSAWFIFISTSRAFGYILDLVCAIYITLVTFSFLIIDIGATSSEVGLALTQAVAVTGMFQWGMRQSAELENCMTSVERIMEYSKLEREGNPDSPPDKKPDKSWPSEGRIDFENVYLRYGNTEPWVLKALTFNVEPQQKVGIVGRTGAGKSSLIGSLFRMSEISGKIVIDGIDVGGIGLKDLRSKISIIPQEPMLFVGTMRKNLDLFDEYTDEMLWNVLEQVELKDVIKALPQGLQTMISEGGVNMSVGQRQLVCLARALLRKSKILVLDEATANVDPQTDALIQKTIRDKFKECTVLTIAHRLNTVMDSDKVLVMSAGSVVEFDHSYNLLQNKDGYFYSLVHQTGKKNEDMLHSMAAEAYKNREKRLQEKSKSSSTGILSPQKSERSDHSPRGTAQKINYEGQETSNERFPGERHEASKSTSEQPGASEEIVTSEKPGASEERVTSEPQVANKERSTSEHRGASEKKSTSEQHGASQERATSERHEASEERATSHQQEESTNERRASQEQQGPSHQEEKR